MDTGPLVAGELEIRADQFQAFVRASSVDLTRREFEVLQLLAQAKGKVLQREEIYQAVWGYAMAHGDRSVDVFVRKVRQKLEKASPDWNYIHTHFGVGYRFEPERRGDGDIDPLPPSEPRDRRAPGQRRVPRPPGLGRDRTTRSDSAVQQLLRRGADESLRHTGRDSAADEGRPRESKGRGPGRAVGVGGDDRDEPVVDQLPGGLACVIAVIAGQRAAH